MHLEQQRGHSRNVNSIVNELVHWPQCEICCLATASYFIRILVLSTRLHMWMKCSTTLPTVTSEFMPMNPPQFLTLQEVRELCHGSYLKYDRELFVCFGVHFSIPRGCIIFMDISVLSSPFPSTLSCSQYFLINWSEGEPALSYNKNNINNKTTMTKQ